MKLFDAHCHYNDEKFDIDRDMLIKEVHDSGVVGMINAGYSLSGSVSAVDLSNKYDFIYATVGISPNDVTEDYVSDIEKIEELLVSNLKNGKIVAIGEIGLDYHYDVDRDMQKDAFIRQIELANKYDLPIVIHTREATVDTINILKENPVNKVGMFHCCPLNQELVKEALKLGFYISVCGPITFKNSKNAEVIANMIKARVNFVSERIDNSVLTIFTKSFNNLNQYITFNLTTFLPVVLNFVGLVIVIYIVRLIKKIFG